MKYFLFVLFVAIVSSAVATHNKDADGDCARAVSHKKLHKQPHHVAAPVPEAVVEGEVNGTSDDAVEGLNEILEALEEDLKSGHLNGLKEDVERIIEEDVIGSGKTPDEMLHELLKIYERIHA